MIFDPVILDAIFHPAILFQVDVMGHIRDYESRDMYLPARVSRVTVSEKLRQQGLPTELAACYILSGWNPGTWFSNCLRLAES